MVGELLFVKRSSFVEDFPDVFKSVYNGVQYTGVPQGLLLLAATGVYFCPLFFRFFADLLPRYMLH